MLVSLGRKIRNWQMSLRTERQRWHIPVAFASCTNKFLSLSLWLREHWDPERVSCRLLLFCNEWSCSHLSVQWVYYGTEWMAIYVVSVIKWRKELLCRNPQLSGVKDGMKMAPFPKGTPEQLFFRYVVPISYKTAAAETLEWTSVTVVQPTEVKGSSCVSLAYLLYLLLRSSHDGTDKGQGWSKVLEPHMVSIVDYLLIHCF